MIQIRKGQPSVALDRAAFQARFEERFVDPTFDVAREEIARLADLAWEAYAGSRKAPRTTAAGPGFADPSYELSVDWLAARAAIQEARRAHDDPRGPSRILIVAGGARNEHTCPGEMAKTYRLAELARDVIVGTGGFACDLLDLSEITAAYGRTIHPCKACVSTAMPLCHWPCSCYPNHSLGQVNDWMNELYPRWVAAHGIVIVTPVYWLQAPSTLKLMIDRLVCADGGNPDPTSTHGKDAAEAKALEVAGWPYPRHLAGRAFGVVVHGDAEGVDALRNALVDWLQGMQLVHAGGAASLSRYVGYFEPYATSHDALDRDAGFQEEVRNATRAVIGAVEALRRGEAVDAGRDLVQPRPH